MKIRACRFARLFTMLLCLGAVPALAQQNWRQLVPFGGRDMGLWHEQVTGMVTDSAGNFYLAGIYSQGATLGGFSWPAEGQAEAFVARFDSAGTFQWVRTIYGPGEETIGGVCLGPGGSCYITGNFEAQATADGGITRQANLGIFVAAYDAQGTMTWFDTPYTSGNVRNYVEGIAVDPTGACYVGGLTLDGLVFGGVPLVIPGADAFTPFVARYAANHTVAWVRGSRLPGAGFITVNGMVADTAGCYVAVQYPGEGGSLLGFPVGPTANTWLDNDGVVVALARDGTMRWGQTITNAGAALDGNVELRKPVLSGSALVVPGYCDSTTTFSGGAGGGRVLSLPVNRYATFLAQYDRQTGRLDTVMVLARGTASRPRDIAGALCQVVEHPTGWYLAGYFRGTVQFGTNAIVRSSFNSHDYGVVAAFDYQGTCRWVQRLRGGLKNEVTGLSVGIGSGATVRVAGYFQDSLTTDAGRRYLPNGPYDMFYGSLSQVLGVADEAPLPGAEVEVWPNPTTGVLHIRVAGATAGLRGEIVDLLGRTVLRFDEQAPTATLTLPAGLAAGVYLLRVPDARKPLSRTFVVQP